MEPSGGAFFVDFIFGFQKSFSSKSRLILYGGVDMNSKYKQLIAKEFRNCVLKTIDRVNRNEQTYRPFHTALLSEDVIFWSGFERSFSTSFGQRVIEEIARLVALSNGAEAAERQHETFAVVNVAYENAIQAHMQRLRSGERSLYDWNSTLDAVFSVPRAKASIRHRIISDLWWKKDGINHYVSLKTVKPNIDQTAVAKEDCLRLTAADQKCKAYFGLPYNPYGERKEDYNHNPPMGIFDFRHDSIVLIGKDLWDTLGGPGCYEDLLSIARDVGRETKAIIERMRG